MSHLLWLVVVLFFGGCKKWVFFSYFDLLVRFSLPCEVFVVGFLGIENGAEIGYLNGLNFSLVR